MVARAEPAYGGAETKYRTFESGAKAILSKPIDAGTRRIEIIVELNAPHWCIPWSLLRCTSPELALFGHGAMSDPSPLCAPKRSPAQRHVANPLAPVADASNETPGNSGTPACLEDVFEDGGYIDVRARPKLNP
jgi:hypothetical protein